MPLEAAKVVLTIYAWVVIGVLLFILWRIARFYERASKQQVRHRLLLLPAALLSAGVIWYLGNNRNFVGSPTGDLLLFAGGVLLFLFSSRLATLMTGER
ncbi:MAG: hypothetical protein ACOC7Y_01115 [Chloroflexota bacterium]